MKIKIEVKNEGINFACRGHAIDARTGRRVYSGRTIPHGMRSVAHANVESWAREHGHEIVE